MDKNVGLLEEFDAVWKSLTALGGIYLLFIIEHCIGMFKHYKDEGVRRNQQGGVRENINPSSETTGD